MVQSFKHLMHKHGNPNFIPRNPGQACVVAILKLASRDRDWLPQ